MNYEFSFNYLTCQSCTARIHCEQCQNELTERLLRADGVTGAQIDIPSKRLRVSTASLNEMDVLDLLEEMSIFAD